MSRVFHRSFTHVVGAITAVLPVAFSCALLVAVIGGFAGYRLVYTAFDKYNDSRLEPIAAACVKIYTHCRCTGRAARMAGMGTEDGCQSGGMIT